MKVFVARQAILDRNQGLFGYELLFRNGESNSYQGNDGDLATIEVIRNSFLNIGMGKVVQGKKAFINFTENLLKSDLLTIMPPEDIVVEILETIEPTEEIIKHCKNLKEKGYILALDDFVFNTKYKKLMEFIDIIKVDFRITRGYRRKRIMDSVQSDRIKFLAEKVETVEEYNQAIAYGYSYFQGYYFSKPVLISAKKIPENNLVYMKILKELNSRNFNIENIENLIKKDISLSYKILKLINSARYSLLNTIQSIKQAIAFLGEIEVKKWLYVISVKSIGSNKPECIITDSLVRARLCELLAVKVGNKDDAFYSYLIGLLSRMDILLDTPLDEVLAEILVPREVTEVLIEGKENKLKDIYSIAEAYERADWETVSTYSKKLGIDSGELAGIYIEAIQWANNE